MRILMLAPQPFFQPRGTPFSVLGRLRALSKLGHEVDLVTYHVGVDVAIPKLRIHRIPHIHFIKDVSIGPSWKKLFLDVLLFIKAFHLLQRSHYDLLHTHEEASFIGMWLAKRFGIRHLYDMHSSLPQQLSNFQYSRFRPLIELFEWLERRVINSSDAIITICPALEEQVKRIKDSVLQVMIENVASGDDVEVVSEEELRTFARAYSFGERRIVLYTGTFEAYQGIELLINSAVWVFRQRKDVMFLLVGGKPDQVRHYQGLAVECGVVAHFSFAGSRPPVEIPRFLRLADILVSPRISGTNTPLKIYSYLQSGKPIVATDLPMHTQILNHDVAILVKPQPEAFARGILTLLQEPALANRLGRQAQQLCERCYSFQAFLEKTEQVLQMALG